MPSWGKHKTLGHEHSSVCLYLLWGNVANNWSNMPISMCFEYVPTSITVSKAYPFDCWCSWFFLCWHLVPSLCHIIKMLCLRRAAVSIWVLKGRYDREVINLLTRCASTLTHNNKLCEVAAFMPDARWSLLCILRWAHIWGCGQLLKKI